MQKKNILFEFGHRQVRIFNDSMSMPANAPSVTRMLDTSKKIIGSLLERIFNNFGCIKFVKVMLKKRITFHPNKPN